MVTCTLTCEKITCILALPSGSVTLITFHVNICGNSPIWFSPLGTSLIGMLFTSGGSLGIFEASEFSEKFLRQICILELEKREI